MYFGEDSIYLEFSRKDIPDSDFGIPSLRKYPMHDEKHVRLAIKFFNRCPKGYEKELAKNIDKKINELKVININPTDKNKFFDYSKIIYR